MEAVIDTTVIPMSSTDRPDDLSGVDIFGVVVGVFAIMGFIVAVIVAIGCCTCYNVILQNSQSEQRKVPVGKSSTLEVKASTPLENIFKVPVPFIIKWIDPHGEEIKDQHETTCQVDVLSDSDYGPYRCLIKSSACCPNMRPFKSKDFTLVKDVRVEHDDTNAIDYDQIPGSETEEAGMQSWENVDNSLLDKDYHWNQVCQALREAAAGWRAIGQALGIPNHILEVIAVNNPPGPATAANNSLGEVIRQWHGQNYDTKECGTPSWRTLIERLHAYNAVDNKILRRIAEAHKKDPDGIN